jgi:type 1 glutamine amidotransferase
MRIAVGTWVVVALCIGLFGPSVWAADPQSPQRPGLPADASTAGRKKIVFISGKPSHGFAQHEQYAGCMLLAKDLNENVPGVEAVVYKWEWPSDPHAFDGAAAIVIFCDGGAGHIAIPHLQQLSELMDKGVGLGCIHYAVELPKDQSGQDFMKWIGGYFEPYWSMNPEWTAHFTQIPPTPASNAVHPFSTHDEWYIHMRFRDGMEGVTPILSAVPPQGLRGTDAAHNGTAELRGERDVPQHVVWIATRDHDGRGFGCTGAHYHFNWASDNFRKTILNAIAWTAHVEVPADGIASKRPTPDELLENLDPKKAPKDFSKEKLEKEIEGMNRGE